MTKKLYTESHIEDIADALREKLETTDKYTVAEMGDAVRSIETGGVTDIINGTIERYKAASATIDPNTFVEFVEDLSQGKIVGTDTQIADEYRSVSAVALDENTVAVVHPKTVSSTTNLYVTVYSIAETSISVKYPATKIDSQPFSPTDDWAKAVKLGSNSLWVLERSTGITTLLAIQLLPGGSAIGSRTAAVFSSTDDSDVTALGQDKCFLAFREGTNIYGTVCAVGENMDITYQAPTQLVASAGSTTDLSVVTLSSSKIFVVYQYGQQAYPGGIVGTISGTAITPGTAQRIQTTGNNAQYVRSVVVLDSSRVLVIHRSSDFLYGTVCTISGATFTMGTDTRITTSTYARTAAVKTGLDEVFLAYRAGSDNYLYGLVMTFTGNVITAGAGSRLSQASNSGDNLSATAVSNGKAFIAHKNDIYSYGIVIEGVWAAESSITKIDGLTKTTCTSSTAGDVWILA